MEDQIRRGKEIREQEAFLKTAIKNLATDDFRRTRHEGVVVDQTEAQAVESDAPTPSDIVERDDRMRWLCAHLDKVLGKPTRDIFIYNRVQGYTYHEISELLGMSPRTIEKHIARALVVLTELKKTDDV
jgi:RNA polymerase sigma-70 factor (ECF subfamily)